jgi:lipoprotein-releasing system ATP-binding protein
MVYAVEVSNLKKTYHVGQTTIHALNGVSFSIEQGEFVAIVGESGSGKSTLLNILGALDTPTSGHVRIAEKNPFHGSDNKISKFRNLHIGFVFQHNNLLPEFNALENIMIPALIAGQSKDVVLPRALDFLQKVNLEKRKNHFPSQLSGGEQQRVAIARALINNPLLLLADEPSGNLDSHNAHAIHDLFYQLNRDMNVTVLVVTHNLEFAKGIPRKIRLKDGLLVQ